MPSGPSAVLAGTQERLRRGGYRRRVHHDLPRDIGSIGRRFGEWYRQGVDDADLEVDRATLGWMRQWAREASGPIRSIGDEAQRIDEERRAAIVAADPSARDAIAPAAWRKGLRILAVLGGACAIASAVTGLGFVLGGEGRRSIDPTTTAPLLALGGLLAIVALTASLLPPSRAGVPGAGTAMLVDVFGAGTIVGTVALWAARDGWGSWTVGWWVVATVASTGFVVLFVVVRSARLRLSRERRSAHLAQHERLDVDGARIADELEAAAVARLHAAWDGFDPELRAILQTQRREALEALVARGHRFDVEAWLADPPGARLLTAAADAAFRRLVPTTPAGRERPWRERARARREAEPPRLG